MALFDLLVSDLRGAEPFQDMICSTILSALGSAESVPYLELTEAPRARVRREGWRDRAGVAPTDDEIGWIVADLLRRAEACGVVVEHTEPRSPRRYPLLFRLTPAGRRLIPRLVAQKSFVSA